MPRLPHFPRLIWCPLLAGKSRAYAERHFHHRQGKQQKRQQPEKSGCFLLRRLRRLVGHGSGVVGFLPFTAFVEQNTTPFAGQLTEGVSRTASEFPPLPNACFGTTTCIKSTNLKRGRRILFGATRFRRDPASPSSRRVTASCHGRRRRASPDRPSRRQSRYAS
jgi:hypothetical protein